MVIIVTMQTFQFHCNKRVTCSANVSSHVTGLVFISEWLVNVQLPGFLKTSLCLCR